LKQLGIILFVLTLVASLPGCATSKRQQPPPLTQEEIISMARAGKTDQEIIQEIKTRRTYYRLAAKDIINLHENGVSNAVVDYMLETMMQAVRDEQRLYDAQYHWYPYHGHWYYSPPPVVIIKRK
jgi:hypothetical protein